MFLKPMIYGKTSMKRISGYFTVARLLLGIHWLVLRQWCYLAYRRLSRWSGRKPASALE